jgi:hypothetical protein
MPTIKKILESNNAEKNLDVDLLEVCRISYMRTVTLDLVFIGDTHPFVSRMAT